MRAAADVGALSSAAWPEQARTCAPRPTSWPALMRVMPRQARTCAPRPTSWPAWMRVMPRQARTCAPRPTSWPAWMRVMPRQARTCAPRPTSWPALMRVMPIQYAGLAEAGRGQRRGRLEVLQRGVPVRVAPLGDAHVQAHLCAVRAHLRNSSDPSVC